MEIDMSPQIDGHFGPYEIAGAPVQGTNEVQTLTIGGTPTGGTFKLTFDGYTSGPITWSSTNATLLANIQAALDAMPNVGANGIVAAAGSLTAGIGTITLTGGGNLINKALPLMVATSSLTGTAPTAVVAETTPGVDATARGAKKGALLIDTTNGILYINTGTALDPTWTVVGTQT